MNNRSSSKKTRGAARQTPAKFADPAQGYPEAVSQMASAILAARAGADRKALIDAVSSLPEHSDGSSDWAEALAFSGHRGILRSLVQTLLQRDMEQVADVILGKVPKASLEAVFGGPDENDGTVILSSPKSLLSWQAKHFGERLGHRWLWSAARILEDFSIARQVPDEAALSMFAGFVQKDGAFVPNPIGFVPGRAELLEIHKRAGAAKLAVGEEDLLSVAPPLKSPKSCTVEKWHLQTPGRALVAWLFGPANPVRFPEKGRLMNFEGDNPNAAELSKAWLETLEKRAGGENAPSRLETSLCAVSLISTGAGAAELDVLLTIGWAVDEKPVQTIFLRPGGFSIAQGVVSDALPLLCADNPPERQWFLQPAGPLLAAMLSRNHAALRWLASNGAKPPCDEDFNIASIAACSAVASHGPFSEEAALRKDMFAGFSDKDKRRNEIESEWIAGVVSEASSVKRRTHSP